MYRLMRSERLTLDHRLLGPLSTYRQFEIGQFPKFRAARDACALANNHGAPRCYVLNASGQEYYDGIWID